MHEWLNMLGVVLGALLLGYGAVIITQLKKSVANTEHSRYWDTLLAMVVLFIVGYLLFAYAEVTEAIPDHELHTIVSLVFFFGALFVVGSLHIARETIRELCTKGAAVEYLKGTAKQMGAALRKRR